MKLKLPENFGGLTKNGEAVVLEPDADGIVNVGDDVAADLITFGATPVEEPTDDEPAPKKRGR